MDSDPFEEIYGKVLDLDPAFSFKVERATVEKGVWFLDILLGKEPVLVVQYNPKIDKYGVSKYDSSESIFTDKPDEVFDSIGPALKRILEILEKIE